MIPEAYPKCTIKILRRERDRTRLTFTFHRVHQDVILPLIQSAESRISKVVSSIDLHRYYGSVGIDTIYRMYHSTLDLPISVFFFLFFFSRRRNRWLPIITTTSLNFLALQTSRSLPRRLKLETRFVPKRAATIEVSKKFPKCLSSALRYFKVLTCYSFDVGSYRGARASRAIASKSHRITRSKITEV